MRDAKLSKLPRTWDGKTPPDRDVLDLLARAGTDIAPFGNGSTGFPPLFGSKQPEPMNFGALTTITPASISSRSASDSQLGVVRLK